MAAFTGMVCSRYPFSNDHIAPMHQAFIYEKQLPVYISALFVHTNKSVTVNADNIASLSHQRAIVCNTKYEKINMRCRCFSLHICSRMQKSLYTVRGAVH